MPELQSQPGFADAFLPDGRPPFPRAEFKWPAHSKVLEEIASTKGKSFYKGKLADKLEAAAKKQGGALRASDMAAHKSDWVKCLEMDYRGYTLHEIPPNGQGIVALMALGMLEHFDLRSHPVDGPDSLHLQIEAQKLAFADAGATSPTSTTCRMPRPRSLLNKSYLEGAGQADRDEARAGLRPRRPPRSGTVYLSAADASGMMVSFIQSNDMGFGSGVVVDGISLQNRGGTFVVQPGHPNCVGPKKAPVPEASPRASSPRAASR